MKHTESALPETSMPCDLCHQTGDNEHFVRILCPDCKELNPEAYRKCVEALKEVAHYLDPREGEIVLDNAELEKVILDALAHAQGLP